MQKQSGPLFFCTFSSTFPLTFFTERCKDLNVARRLSLSRSGLEMIYGFYVPSREKLLAHHFCRHAPIVLHSDPWKTNHLSAPALQTQARSTFDHRRRLDVVGGATCLTHVRPPRLQKHLFPPKRLLRVRATIPLFLPSERHQSLFVLRYLSLCASVMSLCPPLCPCY